MDNNISAVSGLINAISGINNTQVDIPAAEMFPDKSTEEKRHQVLKTALKQLIIQVLVMF